MRALLIGVSALVLMSSAAYAQQPAERMSATETAPTRFLVFFNLDDATLTPEGAQVVSRAADEYKRTGAAKVAVTGYTDLSGSPSYNLALSQRRAEAVERELVRLGVPGSVIGVTAEGENDPLVPTADGVREPQNRRVAIEIPHPAPAPVAAPIPAPVAGCAAGRTAARSEVGAQPRRRLWQQLPRDQCGNTSALAGAAPRGEYLVTPNVPSPSSRTSSTAFKAGRRSRRPVHGRHQCAGDLGAAHPYRRRQPRRRLRQSGPGWHGGGA